ncbi:MAG: hypothetical protein K6E87_07580 [bacterium]|nr:hypothetical protein [bacterium]
MLKENLRLILKNRLTWIVFLILIIVIVSFSLSKVFNEYYEFEKYLYDGKYVVKRPFAVSVFSKSEEYFGAVMILVSPICLAFCFYKNDSTINISNIRGNILRQRIYSALSIALITAIFFFIAYMIGMLTFYFTLNPKMNPYGYSDYINGTNDSLEFYVSKDLFMKDLFWINKGNTTYIYYTIHALLFSIIMFSFILITSSFTYFFKSYMQVIVFIVFTYIFLLGNSYFYDNIFTNLIQMPSLVYDHKAYDKTYILSWIMHPIIFIVIASIFFTIQGFLIKRKNYN